uniref:Virulent strain associated lipoprotein n=1 Tax=Zea mays TaxID=4577 RepID=B6UH56_MAIZE|nr:virulent strain associated lipoprotein [Zea mays]
MPRDLSRSRSPPRRRRRSPSPERYRGRRGRRDRSPSRSRSPYRPSYRRRSPLPSPRRRESCSPSPRRRNSPPPSRKRYRRKSSPSVISSPVTASQSSHLGLEENKNAIDTQRLEEEKKRWEVSALLCSLHYFFLQSQMFTVAPFA